MDNGCDPELSLRLGSGYRTSSADSDSTRSIRVENWFANASQIHQQQQQQQQQITIFHNGRMCVCDVTEIQARAIICMAKKEMEERLIERKQHEEHHIQWNRENDQYFSSGSASGSVPSSPTAAGAVGVAPQLIYPGLSMKRSLQRFLQKRKTRVLDASSPYNNNSAHDEYWYEEEPRTPSPS